MVELLMTLHGEASLRESIFESLEILACDALHTGQTVTPWLVHGGTAHQQREKGTILPWNDLSPLRSSIAS